MSCIILEAVQVQSFSQSDTLVHIRAGSIGSPGLSCDTVSDLPAQSGGLTGYYLEQGSTAHVIETNTIYTLKSDGVWVIQDEASRMNVYTKPEIDSMLEDYTTTADQNLIDAAQDADIDNLQATDTIHLNALKWIVDKGNVKNLCPESSATATANYTIDMDLPAGTYVVQFGSLTSTDTDYTTCQVIALYGATVVSTSPQLQMNRGTNVHGTINVASAANKLQIYASRTGTMATGDTLTFSDLMVCAPELYAISTAYVPYAQTNQALTP